MPITLEVADYVLTPTAAIERKSLSDLVGSLQTGRLFNQMTAMCRHFSRPMLLIEFDPAKPFALSAYSNAASVTGPISAAELSSKLALLTLHFPQLRILWARSPQAAAALFARLKAGQPEPELASGAGVSAAAMATDDATAAMTPQGAFTSGFLLSVGLPFPSLCGQCDYCSRNVGGQCQCVL